MQFSIFINQSRAVEWGLNSQQALLFAYLYTVPSWAASLTLNGLVYYRLDKAKVIDDLPILTDKADTVYRLLKQLVEIGLVEMGLSENRSVIRLTEKAAGWNRGQKTASGEAKGSENFPSGSEKNPIEVGKKSDPGSEKNPSSSSLYINNPIINTNTTSESINQDSAREASVATGDASGDNLAAVGDLFAESGAGRRGRERPEYPDWFAGLWEKFPPRTGANDKRRALHCANARLAEGKTTSDLLEAVDRYARFVKAKGWWGGQYVMQAQTFFGPGGHIDNSWSFKNDFSPQPPRPPKESAIERAFRHAAEICADADAIENDQRTMGSHDADVWAAMDGQPG